MRRNRHIKNSFLTMPRLAIREPGIYLIKVKVSQVIIEKIKELPGHRGKDLIPEHIVGEGKDRGSVDTEERHIVRDEED